MWAELKLQNNPEINDRAPCNANETSRDFHS